MWSLGLGFWVDLFVFPAEPIVVDKNTKLVELCLKEKYTTVYADFSKSLRDCLHPMDVGDLKGYTEDKLMRFVGNKGGPDGLVPPWLEENQLWRFLRGYESPSMNRLTKQMELTSVGGVRSIRHGIPPLGGATVSWSKPWLDTGHEPATIIECDSDLKLVAECGQPRRLVSSIWHRLETTTGTEFLYAAESSVHSYVTTVLEDVVYELRLNRSLRIAIEVGTFGLRPDAWVLTMMGMPIGVIEVKNPGDRALTDERVAGELYDYMKRLSSFYGAQEAFGILTTYRKWRVCWMDDEASKALARKEVCLELEEREPSTPVRSNAVGGTSSSPEGATPSKKKASVHPLGVVEDDACCADEEESQEVAAEGGHRSLCASRVYDIEKEGDQKSLFRLLASAVWKMWESKHDALPDPFDRLNERTLLMFTRDSYFWGRIGKADVKPQWDKVPTMRASRLFAVEDLGHGAEGRCWLVCSQAGRVAVLKFFREHDDGKARTAAETEKQHWDQIYPALGKMVKVEQWGGHWALVMPHLSQAVERSEQALEAVRATLTEDYVGHKLMQPLGEVKWRNIGFYESGVELKAVVFDMSRVEPLADTVDGDKWVESCIDELKKRAQG